MKCVLSIRAAFTYRQMCEKSDLELQKILQKHLSSASLNLQRIDKRSDKFGSESDDAIEVDTNIDARTENVASEVFIEPTTEIESDAHPLAFTLRAVDLESKNESSIGSVQMDTSPPHSFNDAMTADASNDDDDSHDSFKRYEMWEEKQKRKRKKLTSAKLKEIKAR